MPENEVALEVYLNVHNQHIMGFSGPIDLNFQSVNFILDTFGIENKKEVFERVYNLYKKVLKDQQEEFDRKRELGVK